MRRKKFTTIPITPEMRQAVKEIMKSHPKFYASYEEFLRVAVILLRTYRPEIIFSVCKQPFTIVKIPPNTPKDEVKKRLNRACDVQEELNKMELEG